MSSLRRVQLVGVAVLCGVLGGVWLSLDRPAAPLSAPESAASSSATSLGVRTAAQPDAAAESPALAALDKELAAWRELFVPRGRLSVEQTRALVAQRDAQAEALAERIGALTAEELAALRGRFGDGTKTRDKLVLVDGLGRNPDTLAVGLLEDLYAEEGGYTMRSHIMTALGDSGAPDHTVLLVNELWGNPDERLSQTAAMMLRGEEAAASDLAAAIESELPLKTRLEAIASLGAVGTPEAEQALQQVASDEDAHARVRAYAEKELVRSFG